MADRLETVLSESVAARMVADVPVGAFLSGGIDSSLIVALMQRHSSVPVRTFTVGFVDRAFDESAEAAAVAAHLGTDHTPLEVHDVEAAEVIPALPDIWDEPFGDVSQIPMHLVSRLARTRVTVSLSGDGGDELFAGYNRHAWLERLWRRSSGLPGPVRRSAGAALGSIPPALVESAARAAALLPGRPPIRNPSSKVAKVAKVMGASGAEDAYLSLASYWDDAESMVIGAGPTVSVASRPSEWPDLDGITEQMLWLDLVGYLPDDILTKLDRAAMAVSLENPGTVPRPRRVRPGLAAPAVHEAPRRDDQVDPPSGPPPPRSGGADRATEDGFRLPHRGDAAWPAPALGGGTAGRGPPHRSGPPRSCADPAGMAATPRWTPGPGLRALGCARASVVARTLGAEPRSIVEIGRGRTSFLIRARCTLGYSPSPSRRTSRCGSRDRTS